MKYSNLFSDDHNVGLPFLNALVLTFGLANTGT
jgi:hypothetical protein